jgi:RNA polymerase sigma-70 factor (ECF subfamily)
VNVTRMHLRKRKSRPRFADVDVPETPSEDQRVLDPGEEVDQRKRIRALYDVLETLSEKKREVLVMHDFDGVAAKEIAESLDIPVLTVRTRLFYARKELYTAMRSHPALQSIVESLVKTTSERDVEP